MQVAGVDGCRGGWLVVLAEAAHKFRIADIFIACDFENLVGRTRDCQAVGVDIPIGLSKDVPRLADIEARRLLRGPRASSVFPAPVWALIEATDNETPYADACRISREFALKVSGEPAAITIQAYCILDKIRDANLTMTPRLQETMIEVHPEVSFWALNAGKPMAHRKSRAKGKLERLEVLRKEFDGDLLSNWEQFRPYLPQAGRKEVAMDDFLDACAAAWSARRRVLGWHKTLPDKPMKDRRRLRMEIVY